MLWRMVMGHRTAHPVPITYVFAAALGLIVGLVLQFTIGFPWWIPTIAAPIIAWLVFFSSIWWPTPGNRRSLRQSLRDITHPAEASERHRAEHERMLRESTLPWLWFAQVPDENVMPGGSSSDGVVDAIHLNHVEFDDDGNGVTRFPEYSVTVYEPTLGRERVVGDLRGELIGARYTRAIDQRGSGDDTPEERHELFDEAVRRAHEEFEALEWRTRTVVIDGAEHEAQEAQTELLWATMFEVDGHVALATVRGEAAQRSTEFVRIHDRNTLIERSLARW